MRLFPCACVNGRITGLLLTIPIFQSFQLHDPGGPCELDQRCIVRESIERANSWLAQCLEATHDCCIRDPWDASEAGLFDPERMRSRGFHTISWLMLAVHGALFGMVG